MLKYGSGDGLDTDTSNDFILKLPVTARALRGILLISRN